MTAGRYHVNVWLFRIPALLVLLTAAMPLQSATVLVLRFHNVSAYPDLNWVGESVSEVLRTELSASKLIVLDRDTRAEAMRRLSLRSDADFTKATLIRLGQSVDADYLIYGSYDAKAASPDDPAAKTDLRESSLQITAHTIDLRHLHDGPEVSETGKLSDLARLEEHLAWQSVKYTDPQSNPPVESFLAPQKLIRADAQESYVRGLLSTSNDQKVKWFEQASAMDGRFAGPAFELGKLFLEKKDYRQAIQWFQRMPASDARYPEARFRMGLAAYRAADYAGAANYFREVAKTYPLNEVYNNLGAAEEAMNLPAAIDDYRRALEGDPNDTLYSFNLGVALLRKNVFPEAAARLTAAAGREGGDEEAETLLSRAEQHTATPAGAKPLAPARVKENFDVTAFRELKAMLAPKGEN
jgi:tetratricopeptide (TPR) repeat protein